MSRQNVNIASLVNRSILAARVCRVNFISIQAESLGSLNLNLPKPGARIEDEVVTLAGSPRLGHFQTQALRLVKECSLRKFSDAFGVLGDFDFQFGNEFIIHL